MLWSAAVIVLFFVLDKKPRPHGFYIAVIGLLYAPFRFGLDFLREADATYFGLTPAQYACVLTMFVCGYLLRHYYTQPITVVPRGLLAEPAAQGGKSSPAKAAHT